MDNTHVRTASELERKYNLSALNSVIKGVKGNVETNAQQIINVQTQLNDNFKAIVYNLGDTLQSSVSLWFYEGTPTTSNEPYIDWVTPSDHIDDLYYDQASGEVYKYTATGWVQQTDTNLIGALALTNTELDVSQDNERQVYLTQPSPPYQSGDWWIKEDGTLYICQLGKPSGVYEENDFVTSAMYTPTISSKQDGAIKVIQGQVTTIIQSNDGIKSDVAETQQLVDANGAAIGELSNRVTTLQTSTSYEINVLNTRLDNGVEKLYNTLVKIDSNGINTSRADETFNTQITNKTFEVKDGTKEIAFMGYDSALQKTIARINELEARKITAGNHRCEAITENNEALTAWYFVGGGS